MRTSLLLLASLGLIVACNDKDVADSGAPADDTASTDDTGDSAEPEVELELTNIEWWLHPSYGTVIYVSWEQNLDADVQVTYSFDEGVWETAPAIEGAAAGTHQQVLVGIPYDTSAEWKIVAGDKEFAGETIETDDLPTGLPVGTVEIADDSAWLEDGKYLLTSINDTFGGWVGGNFWTFIIDRQGRPIWAQRAPQRNWTLFVQVAATGDHILWDEATAWSSYDNGAASLIHRAWLDGEIDAIPARGLHHAFVQMPDETLVWGSQAHGGGEALVKRPPTKDGEDEIIWTCQGDWPGVNHCESNGIFYSPERDTFLYSFYTNSSIVEVDHSTGESLWWAGTVADGYDFDPPESQVDWQHGLSWTDEGTLLISTDGRDDGTETTMVREYTVDHKAGVLTEIWKYDSDKLAGTNGDTWRLANGNTLHLVGSGGLIHEVTHEGDLVWRVSYGNRLLGRGEFLSDLYPLVSPDSTTWTAPVEDTGDTAAP